MGELCLGCYAEESDDVTLRYCPECNEAFCEECWGEEDEVLCPNCREDEE